MRTIKFRGKDRRTGKWFIGTPESGGLDIDPGTVGQFTGLYDKNGKEIFEGDILDFNGLTVEVRLVRGVFAFLVNGELDEELCGDCRTDLFAKVIGNVYENPDILKGGEK